MRVIAALAVLVTVICFSAGCAGSAAVDPVTSINGVLSVFHQAQVLMSEERRFQRLLRQIILPRISREVPALLDRGFAWGINAHDLFHVHLCLPAHVKTDGCKPLEVLLDSRTYHLLYHCRENPALQREAWLAELAEIKEVRVSTWLNVLRRKDFDYHDYFYGSGRYSRPPRLSEDELRDIAHLWESELPPGEGQAAGAELYRINELYPAGHWSPVTIYFQCEGRTGELKYSLHLGPLRTAAGKTL